MSLNPSLVYTGDALRERLHDYDLQSHIRAAVYSTVAEIAASNPDVVTKFGVSYVERGASKYIIRFNWDARLLVTVEVTLLELLMAWEPALLLRVKLLDYVGQLRIQKARYQYLGKKKSTSEQVTNLEPSAAASGRR